MHTIEVNFEVKAENLTMSREARIEARAVELIVQTVGCERKLVENVLRIISVFNSAMQAATDEIGG